MRPGPRNLITDIAGLKVGNVSDDALNSGTTVLLCDKPAIAAVQVLGGAPGTRETDLLEAHNSVEAINALVLSGGSAFGLDAASGVQAALRERGVGFAVRNAIVPIVPAAILFDLANGGDKDWGRYPPYREFGFEAVGAASENFDLGTAGAGHGGLVAGLKGGLGSASMVLSSGHTVAALVAVNATGSVTVGESGAFWAAPFEVDGEFGGRPWPHPLPQDAARVRLKYRDALPLEATTIAIVATDATLTKAGAKRLSIAAHDGFSRAIWPAHTPVDGDLVFGLATCDRPGPTGPEEAIELYAAAACVMARAIARGVHAATPRPGDLMPTWQQLYG